MQPGGSATDRQRRQVSLERGEQGVAASTVAVPHAPQVTVVVAAGQELREGRLQRRGGAAVGLQLRPRDRLDQSFRQRQPGQPQPGRQRLARGADVGHLVRHQALQGTDGRRTRWPTSAQRVSRWGGPGWLIPGRRDGRAGAAGEGPKPTAGASSAAASDLRRGLPAYGRHLRSMRHRYRRARDALLAARATPAVTKGRWRCRRTASHPGLPDAIEAGRPPGRSAGSGGWRPGAPTTSGPAGALRPQLLRPRLREPRLSIGGRGGGPAGTRSGQLRDLRIAGRSSPEHGSTCRDSLVPRQPDGEQFPVVGERVWLANGVGVAHLARRLAGRTGDRYGTVFQQKPINDHSAHGEVACVTVRSIGVTSAPPSMPACRGTTRSVRCTRYRAALRMMCGAPIRHLQKTLEREDRCRKYAGPDRALAAIRLRAASPTPSARSKKGEEIASCLEAQWIHRPASTSPSARPAGRLGEHPDPVGTPATNMKPYLLPGCSGRVAGSSERDTRAATSPVRWTKYGCCRCLQRLKNLENPDSDRTGRRSGRLFQDGVSSATSPGKTSRAHRRPASQPSDHSAGGGDTSPSSRRPRDQRDQSVRCHKTGPSATTSPEADPAHAHNGGGGRFGSAAPTRGLKVSSPISASYACPWEYPRSSPSPGTIVPVADG